MANRQPRLQRWAAFFILAVVVPVASWALIHSEDHGTRYDSFAAAERDGAVERGWVPAYLPRSARELEEWHDLDTNAQHLHFRAPPQDLRALATRLEPSSGAVVGRAQRARQNPGLGYFVEHPALLGGQLSWSARCFQFDFTRGTAEMWSCVPKR